MAKLKYACVLTRNLPGLAAFYREVLQADPQLTGPYAEFPTGLGTFCLWSEDAYTEVAGARALPAQGTGRTMLEFEVDDVDAEFLRLQELSDFGVDFILPPTTMTWGNRSIYFLDPDRNLVNLFSHVGSPEQQDDGENSHANR